MPELWAILVDSVKSLSGLRVKDFCKKSKQAYLAGAFKGKGKNF
jgi:hypothetical protein